MESRVTFVDHAGDFFEAHTRLCAGGPENYRAQRYTVEYINKLSNDGLSVATVVGYTETPYDTILDTGVRAIGAGFRNTWNSDQVFRLIMDTKPDRIVLRTPRLGLLRKVTQIGLPVLAMFADSFDTVGWKGKVKAQLIRRYLNRSVINQVGNHGVAASEQLKQLGVRADKVIAWDYPATDIPQKRTGKLTAEGSTILYVGALSLLKGVDDLIAAVANLNERGRKVNLRLVGGGDAARLQKEVSRLGLSNFVEFAGLIPNSYIIDQMRCADIVAVPSRHGYPEGLPLTIYEALCSRTPLIISDHPMFTASISDGIGGLIFKAGNVGDLATKIELLLTNPRVYASVSLSSCEAWERLQLTKTWGEVIDSWLGT